MTGQGRGAPTPGAGGSLVAVVLHFRLPEQTDLAVRSLLASRRPLDRILVVDNDPERRFELPPGLAGVAVELLRNPANLGFSGGMNVGVREALRGGASSVLLVNNDALVPPECIAALERALAARPEAGLAAPVLLSRHRPQIVASAGVTYAPAWGRVRQLGFGSSLEQLRPAAWREFPAVNGCVVLVRRETLESAGLLDEEFFFSFEDLEFCLRAARSGWRAGIVGDAFVYHLGSATLEAGAPARFYYGTRNQLLAVERAAGRSSRLRSTAVVALNLLHALRSPHGALAARWAATWRGVHDYRRRSFGPLRDSATTSS